MLNKELKYVHDKSYLQRHPKLQPKMRAILLDWLLEVRAVRWKHYSYCVIIKMQKLKTPPVYVCTGEWGVQPPPADGLPRSGLLRPLYADAAERQQRLSAAHRHHGALHRLQDRGEPPNPRPHTQTWWTLHSKTKLKWLNIKHLDTWFKSSVFKKLLFVFQEIYPPKIFEFAYVTDGACDTWDIQRTELHILKVEHKRTLKVQPLVLNC